MKNVSRMLAVLALFPVGADAYQARFIVTPDQLATQHGHCQLPTNVEDPYSAACHAAAYRYAYETVLAVIDPTSALLSQQEANQQSPSARAAARNGNATTVTIMRELVMLRSCIGDAMRTVVSLDEINPSTHVFTMSVAEKAHCPKLRPLPIVVVSPVPTPIPVVTLTAVPSPTPTLLPTTTVTFAPAVHHLNGNGNRAIVNGARTK